jgi:hypothetical protein
MVMTICSADAHETPRKPFPQSPPILGKPMVSIQHFDSIDVWIEQFYH